MIEHTNLKLQIFCAKHCASWRVWIFISLIINSVKASYISFNSYHNGFMASILLSHLVSETDFNVNFVTCCFRTPHLLIDPKKKLWSAWILKKSTVSKFTLAASLMTKFKLWAQGMKNARGWYQVFSFVHHDILHAYSRHYRNSGHVNLECLSCNCNLREF